MVTLIEPPLAIEPAALFGAQTTSPVPPTAGSVHEPPEPNVALANVVPEGIASRNVTPSALPGPELVAVATKLILPPWTSVVLLAVAAAESSAVLLVPDRAIACGLLAASSVSATLPL